MCLGVQREVGRVGWFEIFVANPLSELVLPSPVAGLPGKCSCRYLWCWRGKGWLETNPGSAWPCWVVLRLGPLEILQGVALTVLAHYVIPSSLAGSIVRMCVSTCVLVTSL